MPRTASPEISQQSRRLAVIGVGLLGGSVALAARQTGNWRVRGYDADHGAVSIALERGLIDAPADSAAQAVEQADLVVLAVPISRAADVLKEIAPRLPGDCRITDTLSTKQSIVAAVDAILDRPQVFVGAHPMAGSDQSGPAAARGDLFRDARCFVVDRPAWAENSTWRDSLEMVEGFWTSLGCRVTRTSAEAHDQLAAAMSHLPQAVASALAATLDPEELAAGGAGLRDTTRIAGSHPGLWRDILLDNRAAVLDALTRFEQTMGDLRKALEAGDAQALERILRNGSERRRALESRATDHP